MRHGIFFYDLSRLIYIFKKKLLFRKLTNPVGRYVSDSDGVLPGVSDGGELGSAAQEGNENR